MHMETLQQIIADIEFFRGLKREHLELITGCAANVRVEAGTFLGRAGDPADQFWVIREGRMALELVVPGRGRVTIATMSEGEVVGFSWLLPPYHLHFDVRAVTDTRALLFDGRCLRGKCVADPHLGFELLSRFSRVMADRIRAMSLQLLDVYGDHPIESE
jgi:CRP-like cAMP-binding protein